MECLIADLSKIQISSFFEKNSPITQAQCDQEAARIIGGPVVASLVQGGTSYTVVAAAFDNKTSVVQFRNEDSAFDLDLLRCVEKVYSGFAPRHYSAGNLGALLVYTMDNVGGTAMYLAREQLHMSDYALLRETLQDYARFFALAWHNKTELPDDEGEAVLFAQYSSQLQQLRDGLPNRFRLLLEALIIRLPDLFDDDWPLVPNHTDLLENNIHVDAETGGITGICDWKDASIGPFGVSLGGLETMLGIRRITKGWCYHPNQQELRNVFWKTLLDTLGGVTEKIVQRVLTARTVGLFLEHGFVYDDDDNRAPSGEGEGDLPYLEAVTLGLKNQGQCSTLECLGYCGWPLKSLKF